MDEMLMVPILHGLRLAGKYHFEFHDMWHDPNAKQIKEKYAHLLKKTGKPDAVPIFIEEEKNDAIFAPNFEKLMGWLEGPKWWERRVNF
ncbi:hypothetical protein KW805_03605 [Candidatus Pacearchaeota archaeon]|nr:hypothetical protein [Candidatus Pacearchaeota archaeon]